MILNGKEKKYKFSSKFNKQKSSSQLTLQKPIFTQNMKQNNMTVLNFIKQKDRFKIPDFYDEKNSKKFLDSKNKAMSEIILSDELELDNNNKKENKKTNKYNSELELNNKIKKEKKRVSKYNSTTKMLKTQYINEKTSDTDNNKFDYNTNYKMDNSNDSNFIYKFILDNANESEEIFLKKLKKQMKSIEIKNKNSQKTLSKFSESKIDKRKSNFNNKKQSLFKGPNPFRFSRDAKILMINEPIDASSIKSSSFDSQNIIISKISGNEKEEININNIFNKDSDKNVNNSINDIEINSDKDSLMNILSGLMQ